MRLALILDIHGNLVALEAVLAEIAQQNIALYSQHILCLGDVAAVGPQPLQVLARLQSIGCPVVMGNTDTEDDLEPTLSVELRRTPFDTTPLLQAIQSSGIPHAEWLANTWMAV